MKLLISAALVGAFAAGVANAACHTGDIETFFPAFAASAELQKEVVAPRILWAGPDPDGAAEGQMSVVPLMAERVIWPVVPDYDTFIAQGGTVTYAESQSPDGALKGMVATLTRGDDYLANVLFTDDPCWTLIGVMNFKP